MDRQTLRRTSLAALLLATACGPRGRIMDPWEDVGVGDSRAGIAVYDQLVSQTTEKLLANHRRRVRAQGDMLVAFVGIENRSSEDLRDFHESTYETIDTILVNSGVYANVSRRYVDAALRETGITRPEKLFLENGQRRFMSVLTREGVKPEFLMWGKYTSGTTDSGSTKYRKYQLTMEMVNANSGLTEAKETSEVMKEYR